APGGSLLFDNIVGGYEQAGRYRHAQRFPRPEINNCFVLGARLHRHAGRIGGAADRVPSSPGSALLIAASRSITHETAGRRDEAKRVDCGQAVARCEADNEIAVLDCYAIRRQHQTSIWLTRKCLNGALDVDRYIFHPNRYDLDCQRWSQRLSCLQEIIKVRIVGISYERGALN